MVHTPTPENLTIDSPHGPRKFFIFDKVFGENVVQEGVWGYLRDSVDAFLQGYNVSVLAYGQSGSGKSYTMGTSGPAEQGNPELMGESPSGLHFAQSESISETCKPADMTALGVIPRAARVLFERLAGPPDLQRSASSGIRTPTRYSMHSAQGFQSLAKANLDKNWQMMATYVEVGCCSSRIVCLLNSFRYTMNIYEICFFQRTR